MARSLISVAFEMRHFYFWVVLFLSGFETVHHLLQGGAYLGPTLIRGNTVCQSSKELSLLDLSFHVSVKL